MNRPDADGVRWWDGHNWRTDNIVKSWRPKTARETLREQQFRRMSFGLTGPERLVADRYFGSGSTIHRAGWPDMVVVQPSGEVRFIEVKWRADYLRERQRTMHEILRKCGCYVVVAYVNDEMTDFEERST